MAHLHVNGEERVENATAQDVQQVLDSNRMIGFKIGHPRGGLLHAVGLAVGACDFMAAVLQR